MTAAPDSPAPQASSSTKWGAALKGALLALIAAGVSWGLVEWIHPVFVVPEEYHVPNLGAPVEKFDAYGRQLFLAGRKNAILYGSAIGLLLSLSLALGQASSKLLWRRLAAVPLGALAGAAAGLVACLIEIRGEDLALDEQLTHSIAVQVTWWASIGLGVGAASSVPLGSLKAILTGAIAGAIAGSLAALVYVVGMSMLMSSVDTRPLIPLEMSSRMIWIAIAAALIGAIAQSAGRPAVKPA